MAVAVVFRTAILAVTKLPLSSRLESKALGQFVRGSEESELGLC